MTALDVNHRYNSSQENQNLMCPENEDAIDEYIDDLVEDEGKFDDMGICSDCGELVVYCFCGDIEDKWNFDFDFDEDFEDEDDSDFGCLYCTDPDCDGECEEHYSDDKDD